MQLIATDIGFATLTLLMLGYVVSSRLFVLGAMSLPCVLLMTSMIYFYLMPALSFPVGYARFLGMYIESLEWPHLAVGLYAAGALTACALTRPKLIADPTVRRPVDRQINHYMLIFLAACTVVAFAAQVALGKLNAFSDESYDWTEKDRVGDLAFINLFFTMMIPLALVYLIRDRFGVRSLAALAAVCFVLLMTGFRYRLLFVAFAVTASFMLVRRIKIRTPYVLAGTLVGLLGSNAMSGIRKYGAGVDLSKLGGSDWYDILQSFGGEVGPLFAFTYTAANPLPDPIHVTPWVIGILRLVPSFIWKDKPGPEYLDHYFGGFNAYEAKMAGVAAPQHVEILLQFGWIGLPLLAFLYFRFAIFLMDRLSRLSHEARIAAHALAPVFFGFYMPTRGYFFQIFSDGLFTFGPLFLLYSFRQHQSVGGLPTVVIDGARPSPIAPIRPGRR